MQYVQLGQTDLKVSRLCLGGMMFSRKIDAAGMLGLSTSA